MLYYSILSILAAVGYAGNFAITKVYQKQMGSGVRSGIVFNILVGLFSGIIFFAVSGFRWECTAFSLFIALLMTAFVGTYTIIGFKIMSIGSMTVYTVFLMLGGAVVPYLYGMLFLGEAVNMKNVLAMLLVVCTVLLNLFDEKGNKQSLTFILLCCAVFFLNGGTSVVSKWHQIETNYTTVSASGFVVLKSIIRFLFFSIIWIFFRENKPTPDVKMNLKMYLVAIAASAVSGAAYMFQLITSSFMPATVLFPLITGGTIAFSSIFDRLFFGQRLAIRTIISIVTCVVALILFVI